MLMYLFSTTMHGDGFYPAGTLTEQQGFAQIPDRQVLDHGRRDGGDALHPHRIAAAKVVSVQRKTQPQNARYQTVFVLASRVVYQLRFVARHLHQQKSTHTHTQIVNFELIRRYIKHTSMGFSLMYQCRIVAGKLLPEVQLMSILSPI